MTTQTNTQPAAALNGRMALPPFTDVLSDETGYHLVADMPGVTNDKLELTVEDGRLFVLGRRPSLTEGTGEQELRRTFALPDDVDPDGIRAKLQNGTLEITLPKRAELKPKRIPIA